MYTLKGMLKSGIVTTGAAESTLFKYSKAALHSVVHWKGTSLQVKWCRGAARTPQEGHQEEAGEPGLAGGEPEATNFTYGRPRTYAL